jgi:hypothetical protein
VLDKPTKEVDEEVRRLRLQAERHKSMRVVLREDLQAQLVKAEKSAAENDEMQRRRHLSGRLVRLVRG